MEKLPIVTVTFEGELRMTLLQAISIDRLFDVNSISRYILILNCSGSELESAQAYFEENLQKAISPELFSKTQILKWSDYYPEAERKGFCDQQVLKLAVSRFIYEPYYLLLDGKNHFVNPASMESFFRNGKPMVSVVETSSYWREYVVGSLRALNVENLDQLGNKHFDSVTPFMMATDIVQRMIQFLEAKYECSLPKFFYCAQGPCDGVSSLLQFPMQNREIFRI